LAQRLLVLALALALVLVMERSLAWYQLEFCFWVLNVWVLLPPLEE
jgi:hypothetical protein